MSAAAIFQSRRRNLSIAASVSLLFVVTQSVRAQTVIAWGVNTFGQTTVPAAATNVIEVAAGWNHSMALRADGSVVAWGAITNVPADATNITAIAAGVAHSVALRADGSVVAWGDNTFGQTNTPTSATNVIALAVGNQHNLALCSDGAVIAWGRNNFGQTSVPATLTNVVAVTAGADHSMALTDDGRTIIWGGNTTSPNSSATNPVSKTITDAVAISAGAFHNLGLRADGRVFLWGDLTSMAVTPALATNIVAIKAAGTNFNLALRADGRLFGGDRVLLRTCPQQQSTSHHLPLEEHMRWRCGEMEHHDCSTVLLIAGSYQRETLCLCFHASADLAIGFLVGSLMTSWRRLSQICQGRGYSLRQTQIKSHVR